MQRDTTTQAPPIYNVTIILLLTRSDALFFAKNDHLTAGNLWPIRRHFRHSYSV